ncbi:hypothetical protein ES708_22336 [subsurface metagenome]
MKPFWPRLRISYRDVRAQSYVGIDSIDFLMTLFGILFGAATLAVGVFFVTGIFSLGFSFLLLWLGIEFLADKIVTLPYILALIAFSISCVLLGSSEGVRGYKRYLESMSYEENEENKKNEL